ncbi:hypothetical protein LZ30DRAFT_775650 [Colletotrichum cereale]|nr:hypothetical protein LZ30DRAFT_775650 [Colletotrichum cereale]
MLQKALELLAESRKESQWLREALKQQMEVVQRQENMIRDLNAKLEDNTKQLGEELKLFREQLKTIATNATHSPPLYYADAARSAPSSQPTNIRTLSSCNTTPSNLSDITLAVKMDILVGIISKFMHIKRLLYSGVKVVMHYQWNSFSGSATGLTEMTGLTEDTVSI